nr:hypothetical protein DA06_11805 [Georgenia sp. SUBG003]
MTGRAGTMLPLRGVLFGLFQGAAAGVLAGSGKPRPGHESAAWWPLTATATNLVNLVLLGRRTREVGGSVRDYYVPTDVRRNLPVALGLTVLGGALAAGPNLGLAKALWGDPQKALDLFVRPLPAWAARTAVAAFPLSTALAELPTYYGYAQPRLAAAGHAPATVVLLPAVAHSLQHATLPVRADARFVTWRALMFLPFALLVSEAIRRRPALLPYFVVVHLLLDLQAAVSVQLASRAQAETSSSHPSRR